jgi:hypothetical protein
MCQLEPLGKVEEWPTADASRVTMNYGLLAAADDLKKATWDDPKKAA